MPTAIAGRVNVRVIAATNRNLRDMIAEGTFREDLFYRLNVIHLIVPPLRERREDIPALIDYFLSAVHAEQRPPGQAHLAARRTSCSASTRGPATSASWRT